MVIVHAQGQYTTLLSIVNYHKHVNTMIFIYMLIVVANNDMLLIILSL